MNCPDPSSKKYRQHTACRVCGNPNLMTVFSLGQQPLANDFIAAGGKGSGTFPLQVLLCESCGLAQLSVVVDPSVLYYYYTYVTSPSQTMLQHFEALHQDLLDECGKIESVLEIGSNDGRLLAFFREKGATVLGVDPAVNVTKKALIQELPTCVFSFDSAHAKLIRERMPFAPSLIIGRHVFCHIDDWHDFVKTLEMLAGPNTVIALETPYVEDLLANTQFDTIYHEHLSYLSLRPVERLLQGTPFFIRNAIRYPAIHGGAILTVLRHRDSGRSQTESVQSRLSAESSSYYRWSEFSRRAHTLVDELTDFVRNLRSLGKRVVGYGASAKSTIWVNACGFTAQTLDFITDTTREKQGALSPGTNIPIVPPERLLSDQPDYAILFAWNYEKEIVQKEQEFLQKGGHFIVPLPSLRVIRLANTQPQA